MTKAQDSKVIHLRDGRQTAARAGDGLELLRACGEQLVDALMAAFTRQVGRATDELLAMMDQPIDQTQRQLCLDAMAFLSNRTPAMLQRFRGSYLDAFEQAFGRLLSQESRPSGTLSGELSLVDESDFELDLALTKLAIRSAYNCAQQLVALDRRVAAMLKLSRLAQEDDPFYPMTIYRALFQALSGLEVTAQLAIFIMQVFERQTAADLPGIYSEINRRLADAGVLPQIPLSDTQDKDRREASPSGGVAPGASRSGPGEAPGGDVFEQLLSSWQRLAAASGAAPGSGVPLRILLGTPASGGIAAPTLMPGAAVYQPLARDQLVQALGNLQRLGLESGGRLPGEASGPEPAAMNLIAQLRAAPEIRAAALVDTMVIDVVAMLFEAIFKDPDLPDAIRAEIAKLQIPILKVALLDRTFFSDRKHPARRLLDLMAESYLGRSDQEMVKLLERVRAAVKAVLNDFESDIGVFAAQVEGLESFLAEESSKAKAPPEHLVADLARRERQQLAEQRVTAEIQRRTQRPDVPGVIVDFLERGWRQVLNECFVNHGDQSPEWQQAVQLMDELIWSVQPKTTAADRERFIAILPGLIQGLRTALGRLGLEATWNEFFSTLIQRHVAAIRGEGAPGPAPPPSEPTPAPLIEPITARRDRETETADPYLKLVHALQPGAWIEFQTARGTRNTLRLSWVSDFKGVYLFTNRQGENAMTLAASSLADHLRKGRARLLSQNPLTERAVARVMEQMQAQGSLPGAGSQTQDPTGPQNPRP